MHLEVTFTVGTKTAEAKAVSDDVLGVRFRSGRVLVDGGEGGLGAATCIHCLVQCLGGERRAFVVWEGDRLPAQCWPAGGHWESAVGT